MYLLIVINKEISSMKNMIRTDKNIDAEFRINIYASRLVSEIGWNIFYESIKFRNSTISMYALFDFYIFVCYKVFISNVFPEQIIHRGGTGHKKSDFS